MINRVYLADERVHLRPNPLSHKKYVLLLNIIYFLLLQHASALISLMHYWVYDLFS